MTKLETVIAKYGMHDLNPIVRRVKTFADVLTFGKAFLNNKLYRSVDYFAMFGKGRDTAGHDQERERLLQLHDLRCYTTCGQINVKDANIEQRSYVTFYCERDTADRLLPALEARDDIFYVMSSNHDSTFCNFASDCVNVTKVKQEDGTWRFCTNIWRTHGYAGALRMIQMMK